MTRANEAESTNELAVLRRRIEMLEDREAIVALLTRYGIFADLGDSDAASFCYTEDTVVNVGTDEDGHDLVFYGRDGVRQIIDGDGHQANLPRCAHTAGPFDVAVDGNQAIAIGYFRTYVAQSTGNELWRLAFTRFELRRELGDWKIARRTSREVGTSEAQDVLRGALAADH
jgi:SnoaL-like domain